MPVEDHFDESGLTVEAVELVIGDIRDTRTQKFFGEHTPRDSPIVLLPTHERVINLQPRVQLIGYPVDVELGSVSNNHIEPRSVIRLEHETVRQAGPLDLLGRLPRSQ